MKLGAQVIILALLFVSCSHTDRSRPLSADSGPLLPSEFSHASPQNGWLIYGHDYGEQRFARLSEINVENVSRLTPAYVFHTGVIGAFETSPIVSDGVMYVSTAYDGLFALDAETGRLRWKRNPLRGTFQQCCGPVNRGVAISKNLIVLGRLDDNVVALDRKTGAVRWSTRIADNSRGYSITMAPLVYRDLVIVGVGGGDLGIRAYLVALSLSDGKLRWRWYVTDPSTGSGVHGA